MTDTQADDVYVHVCVPVLGRVGLCSVWWCFPSLRVPSVVVRIHLFPAKITKGQSASHNKLFQSSSTETSVLMHQWAAKGLVVLH